MANKISGFLEENILILLCFDDVNCKIIRNSVTLEMFDSAVYRDIATKAFSHIDKFGSAPGDHIADHLENIIKGKNARRGKLYSDVLQNMYDSKDGMNSVYVMSELSKFIKLQLLKIAVVKSVDSINAGNVEDAEIILSDALKHKLTIFDQGTDISDVKKVLSFFGKKNKGFYTGIKYLDIYDNVPARKELFLFIAPPKKGKSWFITHVVKYALIQRLRVLHITLEMSEEKIMQRYMQVFFSLSKRESKVKIPVLEKNEFGMIVDVDFDDIERPSFETVGILKKLEGWIKQSRILSENRLIVKEFPTSQLTVNQLEAYLDSLENQYKFVPDILLIDYPDLMKLDSDNLRISTGTIYKELRGIGSARNIAVVAPTQGTKEAAKARTVDDTMVSEDYSKIATADVVVTYSQTQEEKALNLARLFVSNGRNDKDKYSMVITQAYEIGQFCLDSALITNQYNSLVSDVTEDYG